MKVATIGLGKMGLLHTAILNTLENVQAKAIAEKEGFLKKYIQKLFPELNVYDDYIEMFDKENLDEAFQYIEPLSKIRDITVGVSTVEHAKETFQLLCK